MLLLGRQTIQASHPHCVGFLFQFAKLRSLSAVMRREHVQSDRLIAFNLGKCFDLSQKLLGFFCLGFANSDVHFVEGDQATMYGNAPG